jgi:hypothetical protein
MARNIDRFFAVLLLIGAGGHTFGSFAGYSHQPMVLLWALCASVLAVLLAVLNLLRTYRSGDQALAWIAAAGNTSWLVITIVFGILIAKPFDPRVVEFVVIALALIAFSLKGALGIAERTQNNFVRGETQ